MTAWGVVSGMALLIAAASTGGAVDMDQGEALTGDVSLPPHCATPMRIAGDELARCVRAMTGDACGVAVEAQPSKETFARLALAADLSGDAFRVTRRADYVLMEGGTPRACLYAVYEWLRLLGCEWPRRGGAYEVIPKKDAITWDEPVFELTPAVPRRGVTLVAMEPSERELLDLADFMVRNGYNYLFLHHATVEPGAYAALAEALNARDLGYEFGGHLMPKLLPRDLYNEHPEYFRMEDGERTPQHNFCPSSAEAADIMAANATEQYLEPHQRDFDRFETLHLWPTDLMGGGWCSCPDCAGWSESDQSLISMNLLAQRMPLGETMLAHCAYHTAMTPPSVEAHPNVRLMYAPRERSYVYPIESDAANQWYHACLEALADKLPNEPEVFEYYHDNVMFRFLPIPFHPILGEDVRAYLEAGIHGISWVGFMGYDDFAYAMNSYVLGRCMMRGGPSDDDLSAYCRAVYGSAADSMAAYFDRLNELCATAMDTSYYEGMIDLRVLPPNQPGLQAHIAAVEPLVSEANFSAMEELLEDAASGVEAGSLHAQAVKEQRMLWDYVKSETRTLYLGYKNAPLIYEALEKDSSPAVRERAIAALEVLIDGVERGSVLLDAMPASVTGPFAQPGNGAFEERDALHKTFLQTRLETLKGRR